MSKKNKIAPPKPANCWLPCECGRRTLTTLLPGSNNIHQAFQCGAVISVRVDYDGYGLATIQAGTIEVCEP